MRSTPSSAPCLLALLAASCASSMSNPDAGTPGPTLLSVGGVYPTQVTLEQATNSCGPVTVQDDVTTVTHVPGASNLTLAHAGNSYSGTVQVSGAFSTTPKTLHFGTTDFTLTISGHFEATGFDAGVHVNVVQPGPPASCAYDVHWVATKTGAPNTFP